MIIMKKIYTLLLASTFVACGSSNEKKDDGFKFNRTKKEETKAVQEKTTTPVDLDNRGIGPVSYTHLTLPTILLV